MALDERYTRIIDEDADVKDAHDRPRSIATGIENGRVIMQVGLEWVSMPRAVARQLGYNLLATEAEAEQQQGRRS